jgi:hypothetical protein
MQIHLTREGYLPAGLTTFWVVEAYRSHHTIHGRFTTRLEADACALAHRSRFGPDPVIRQMEMTRPG